MLQPKLLFLAALFSAISYCTAAQSITEKLTTAFAQFEKDPQLQNAIASLYVEDSNGAVVFHKNETIGLAPASTQKIITSATAYELLGKDFRYKTDFGFLPDNHARNSLYIRGSGDPTLGSWRWASTADTAVMNHIMRAAKNTVVNNTVFVDTTGWEGETIPGGWIWEDIGNYYGAGAGRINWHENQYDIHLHSGDIIGSPITITGTEPALKNYTLRSKVTAAAKGSGDNAYIFFPLSGDSGLVRGTIPVGENKFVISGALPQPALQLAYALLKKLHVHDSLLVKPALIYTGSIAARTFYTHVSPPLDSIIYWFDKKSINLYGEALLKTMAFQKTGVGSTEAGVVVLQRFWKGKGIAETALNIVDGSGLSPLNRVTTQAQVAVLQFARKQGWFSGFYNALPEYNGMKLKSGTIRGVKGFAGYHTSRNGTRYVISFLVNNYNGEAATLIAKMYAVLDVLK